MTAMVELYIRKIVNRETNDKTGQAWIIADVPVLWRSKVREALENQ